MQTSRGGRGVGRSRRMASIFGDSGQGEEWRMALVGGERGDSGGCAPTVAAKPAAKSMEELPTENGICLSVWFLSSNSYNRDRQTKSSGKEETMNVVEIEKGRRGGKSAEPLGKRTRCACK